MPHQGSAVVGLDRHQAHLAIGEIEYLQGSRIFDQPHDVVGDQHLGADQHVHREGGGIEQLGIVEIALGAHPGDFGGSVKQGVGDLAGDHVSLVAVGYRQDHIRILGAGPHQDIRLSCMPFYRVQIEPVLQLHQERLVLIDYRNVIGFADQCVGHRAADLACAQDNYFHCFLFAFEKRILLELTLCCYVRF